MKLEERVFTEYTLVNGLKIGGDFKSHVVVYIDSDGNARTKDQIKGSEEYAGFVDGILGNNNRYVREQITKVIRGQVDTEEFLDGNVTEILAKTPIGYLGQYKLGRSLRDKFTTSSG